MFKKIFFWVEHSERAFRLLIRCSYNVQLKCSDLNISIDVERYNDQHFGPTSDKH